MKRVGYITIILLCVCSMAAQQQTVYSNILMNQYLYNSAYAGVDDGTRFTLSHRSQWIGFEGAPVTSIASGYGKLKKKPMMAVGGMVISDRIGLLQRTLFYGTYTYILKVNKKTSINFGLGLGGVQHRVRVYDARPYDKDDVFLGNQVLNGFAFDANAGAYLYSKNFFFGFSNQHMPNAKILWKNSLGRLTSQFYIYSGYNFYVDSKKQWALQPSMLARTNSPAPYQLEFMLKGIYREMIWAGLSYRQGSAFVGLIGCNINKQFMFSYAYDFTVTEISRYSNGTHELMLSYLMPFKKKKSKSEQIQDADEEELNKIDNSLKTNLRNKKKQEKERKEESENKPQSEPPKSEENPGEQNQNSVPEQQTGQSNQESGSSENPQQGESNKESQTQENQTTVPVETGQKVQETAPDQGKPSGEDVKSAPEAEKTQMPPENSQPTSEKPDINGAESTAPQDNKTENGQSGNSINDPNQPQTKEEPNESEF